MKESIQRLIRRLKAEYPCDNFPYCCKVFEYKEQPRMGKPCVMTLECQGIHNFCQSLECESRTQDQNGGSL